MPRATWNGAVIAESDKVEIVEGNVYFPPESVKSEFLRPSDAHTTCWWKGEASYYSLEVDGKQNVDAAWFYPDASEKAIDRLETNARKRARIDVSPKIALP